MKIMKILPLLAILFTPLALKAAEQPNIILIIADDLSWNDLGAYGHPTIHTPNIDKMAKQGVLFNNAYLTASSCSPSRASIITGRYPHNTDAEQLHWAVPSNQITFTEKLKEVGYWTAAAGKWHLGDEIRNRFDLVREAEYGIGDLSGMGDWQNLLEERPKTKPFFLWLASWDAHRPFKQGNHPHKHKQSDVKLPPYYPATELYLDDFVDYYDEIARFDDEIGNIVKKLKKQGIAENTLILIMADNGRPYARDKTTLYDSGVKTPFIAYWPGKIATGKASNAILSSIDIAPTLLELAGSTISASFEGMSFTKLLSNPEQSFRKYAFSERNWHDFEDHGRSVKSAQYRYILNNYNDLPATPSADTVYHATWWELGRLFKQGALTKEQARPFLAPRPKEELYDLVNDPYELNNLANNSKYSTVMSEHKQALAQWIKETNDFIPSFRTLDDFDRVKGTYAPHRKRPRPSKMEMYKASGAY